MGYGHKTYQKIVKLMADYIYGFGWSPKDAIKEVTKELNMNGENLTEEQVKKAWLANRNI